MTQEFIKERIKAQHEIIKISEDIINDLRSICKHPTTENINYSWRPGTSDPALVCADCGKIIQLPYESADTEITSSGINPTEKNGIFPSEDDLVLGPSL